MDDKPLAARLTEVIRAGRIVDAGTTPDGVRFVQADTGNGWGVSFVCGGISYGHESGLWEAALTYGAPDYALARDEMRERDDWGDVLGWLTPNECGAIINRVMEYLPPIREA